MKLKDAITVTVLAVIVLTLGMVISSGIHALAIRLFFYYNGKQDK